MELTVKLNHDAQMFRVRGSICLIPLVTGLRIYEVSNEIGMCGIQLFEVGSAFMPKVVLDSQHSHYAHRQ